MRILEGSGEFGDSTTTIESTIDVVGTSYRNLSELQLFRKDV